ncbi:hypothetical protein OG900_33030 [Streptomyces sp. NBC_00433]
MPDSLPPRIRVTLPGSTTGQITGWQQDQDGQWWATVTVRAPATAVQPVDGEDYSHVPRQPAPQPGPKYVLVAPIDPAGQPLAAELHETTCFAIPRDSSLHRVTPIPTPADARGMLGFPDTTACTACRPEP